MIDLDKSVIHFDGGRHSYRTNIKSTLSTENKNLFLVKECRAETLSERPFLNTGRYEFLLIIEDEKIHCIRTAAADSSLRPFKGTGIRGNYQLSNFKIKKKNSIVESNVNYLSFKKVHELVSSGITNNIYCKIEYEYEAIKYSLISKCEYINYNTNKNDDCYVQPIMGYVPFIFKEQIRYGYVVLNVSEKKNGFLEFLLNETAPIFNISSTPPQNLIKKFIKMIINKLLFFVKINNFTKLISIKESKINFFIYD